jgi:hypothetical protein
VSALRRPRRARRGKLARELQQDLTPLARPNVFVLIWRWRWELAALLGIPTGIAVLVSTFGLMWGLAVIGITAATLALPDVRNALAAHIRCIITAHRVRTGCAQAWIQTRTGKLPIIILTSQQPYGERVYIWCRAGICLDDFEAARDILRSACWARELYITSSARYSHIVILDVIRFTIN